MKERSHEEVFNIAGKLCQLTLESYKYSRKTHFNPNSDLGAKFILKILNYKTVLFGHKILIMHTIS